MKHIKFPLIPAVLILLFACNRIDNAFVEQIQAGLNKAQENKTAFESGLQTSTALFEKMSQAPDGVKNNPKFGFMDVYSRVAMVQQGYSSMIASQDEMAARAQTLLDEYTDGKAKKDSINQEITGILANFDGYQSRIERMSSMIEEAEKGFGQVMAAWEAAPEAEKTASAAMPAPALPDVVAGSAARMQSAAQGMSTSPAATNGATSGEATSGSTAPGGALTPSGTTPPSSTGTGLQTAPKKQ